MAATSSSFAEILNRHRAEALNGPWQSVGYTAQAQRSSGGASRRAAQDRPLSSHSSAHDTSRSPVTSGQNSQRNSMRSSEQLSSFVKHPERRISDLSVVTQIRVPTPSSVDTAIRNSRQLSGRSTPRASTPSQLQNSNVRDADLLTVAGSQEAKLTSAQAWETMAGSEESNEDYYDAQAPDEAGDHYNTEEFERRRTEEVVHGVRNRPGNIMTTSINTNLPQSQSYKGPISPAIPPRSPLRATSPIKSGFPSRRHARNSSSIDRTIHNSSVASSAQHTESENAAANSDVFSQDEKEESYESDISSLGDDEDSEADPDNIASKRMGRIIAHDQKTGRPQLSSPAHSGRSDRSDQRLPAAPSSAAMYDVLTTQSSSNKISSLDFAPHPPHSPEPTKSPASSIRGSSRNGRISSELSRRPPSPALSDISDADSFDSAVPPPVSLYRDTAGPKYRNAAELAKGPPPSPKHVKPAPSSRRGLRSSPNLVLSKSTSWTAAGKTSFAASADARTSKSRLGSATPTGPRSASRAESLPTVAFSRAGSSIGSRTPKSPSFPVGQGVTHTKTFNFSLPSISNIFSGLSRKNKPKKEVPTVLPPLRKITYDNRGQRRVLDINASGNASLDGDGIADQDQFEQEIGDLLSPVSHTRERNQSVDTGISQSSQGTHMSAASNSQAAQSGLRSRERGAPRRTAWR